MSIDFYVLVYREPVVILVLGQVALIIISCGRCSADTGDFILLVGGAGLGRPVGGKTVPIHRGVVIPGLAVGGCACRHIGFAGDPGSQLVTGDLAQVVAGVYIG